MLLRPFLSWGFDLWERLEKKEISFKSFLLLFLCIITLRNLFESFTSSGYIEQLGTYTLHYPLAFVISFLMLTILLSLCSGVPIVRVSRLMLYLWLLILLPPLVDLLSITAHTGERKAIGWLTYEKGRFWWTYLNLYNPFVNLKGATPGIRAQSFLSCILASVYVFIKSKNVVRTIFTPFIVSFFSFCFFSLPTLFVTASALVTPEVINAYSMTFHPGHFFHNLTQRAATTMAVYQLIISFILFSLWLLIYDRRKLVSLFAAFDWKGYAHLILLGCLGFILGWRMFLPSVSFTDFLTNHRDLSAGLGTALALWGVTLFRHSLALRVRSVDGRSAAPGQYYDLSDVSLVAVLIAISFSAVTSYPVLVWTVALMILEIVSRVSPFRAARIPIIRPLLCSATAIAGCLEGFAFFTGNLAPTLLPAHMAVTIIAVFFTASLLDLPGLEPAGRKRDLLSRISIAGALLLAGILLPGGNTLVGMIAISAVFFLVSYLLKDRPVVASITYPLAFVFAIYSIWPKIPGFMEGTRRFPEEIKHAVYGTFMEHDGLSDHAALEFQKAYDLGSEDPMVAFQLGNYAQRRADREAALAFYRRALELDPGSGLVLNNIALLLGEMGRGEEAIPYWDRLLESEGEHERYLPNIATFFIEQGKPEEGLRRLIFLCDEGKDMESVRSEDVKKAILLLVNAVADQSRPEDVMPLVNEARQHPDDGLRQFRAGAALQKAGRMREALLFYDRTLSLLPSFNAVYLLYGSAQQGMGDHQKAVDSFEKFLSEYPGNIEGGVNLSAAYLNSGDIPGAFRVLEGLVKEYPGDPRVMINLASAHLKAGDAGKAEEILEGIVEAGNANALVHFNLGVILGKRGKVDEALQHYLQAVELGMGNPPLYTRVAQYLERAGKRQQALEMYEKAVEADSRFKPALQGLKRLSGSGAGAEGR